MEYRNHGLEDDTDENGPQDKLGNRLSVSDNNEVAHLSQSLAIAASRECPSISTINIDKSSGVHIGPKIVSVVQNVDNNEKVKGRIFGLELVSLSKRTRRLRCSVAVFLCWAFIVAIILSIIIVYLILSAPPQRLDIDLPLPIYIKSVIKNTSRAERIACAASLVILVVCISLIVYFSQSTPATKEIDVAPHSWNITREMWLAEPYNNTDVAQEDEPIRLVVINHSTSSECNTFRHCAAELRNLQGYFIHRLFYDIPYNFIVGNEGRIYEGRGWRKVGAHTFSYNNCTLGIGFIGDYRASSNTHSVPSEAQIQRLHMLLEAGVKTGYLHPDYVIVGAKDIRTNESPGSNLYDVMQSWKHYDKERYRGKSCREISAGEVNSSP